ncbi:MAG: YbaK/EbsC family protein [Acidobacteriia bacterium]|nr:YbaK/EbsC family protein [Terriglobia bacterium]
MPARLLKEYLDREHVHCTRIPHLTAYTAQEIASLTHTPGEEMAKTVMVKIDGSLVMAVLPASFRIDLGLLRAATRAGQVELVGEADFKHLFPDCETGAMPPFGNLYHNPVLVDSHLTRDEEIAFNAGRHDEVVRMRYRDFNRLVKPEVVEMAASAH